MSGGTGSLSRSLPGVCNWPRRRSRGFFFLFSTFYPSQWRMFDDGLMVDAVVSDGALQSGRGARMTIDGAMVIPQPRVTRPHKQVTKLECGDD